MTEQDARQVRRRTLVRVGTVSAWTAPLVLASVPAYAATCSQGSADYKLTELGQASVSWDPDIDRATVSTQIQVFNAGTESYLTSLTVTRSTQQPVTYLAIGQSVPGEYGQASQDPFGTNTLTVTLPTGVGGQLTTYSIQYQYWAATGVNTHELSFQPECGPAATISLTTTVGPV